MDKFRDFLNKVSNKIYGLLEKLSNTIIKNDNNIVIKTIIKVIVLLLTYILLGILCNIIKELGILLIYLVGLSGRAIIAWIWRTVIWFTYILFIIVSIYRLVENIEDNEKLIFKNKRKDDKVKNNIKMTIRNIVKVLSIIILIPLFVCDIGLIFTLGLFLGYIKDGIYLISIFGTIIGLIIFFTGFIFLVKSLLSNKNTRLKKYFISMVVAIVVVSLSSVLLVFEVKDYKRIDNLTEDFNESAVIQEYKLNKNKKYHIITEYYKEVEIVEDEDMGSYMQVEVRHYTTNSVNTKLEDYDKKVNIVYTSDLDLEIKDYSNIYNLLLTSIKDKKLYNYLLLKYPKIKITVSPDYRDLLVINKDVLKMEEPDFDD